MSRNSTTVGSSPSARDTAALITNNARTSAHVVDGLLHGFLDVLSSNDAGHPDIDQPLALIRKDLESLVVSRGEGERDIKSILQSVLDREILQHLERNIEKQVDEYVDIMLPQLVESLMDEYIPKSLREKADRDREQLNALHVQLHNMNARNQNASIKSTKHLDTPISHLLNKNRVVCDLSPTSVHKLLELSDEKLSELVKFYGMSDPGKRTENVNWFLQFLGAALYYVPS